jgi:hypothetical protein
LGIWRFGDWKDLELEICNEAGEVVVVVDVEVEEVVRRD